MSGVEQERTRLIEEFAESLVEALHGLHSAIGVEDCEVQRCREWIALRSMGAPSADDVRGILADG